MGKQKKEKSVQSKPHISVRTKKNALAKLTRVNVERRDEEQRRDTAAREVARRDAERRDQEQRRDTAAREVARRDAERREQERARNSQMQIVRIHVDLTRFLLMFERYLSPKVLERYALREKCPPNVEEVRRNKSNCCWTSVLEKFSSCISESPEHVCCSCGGLYYSASVTTVPSNNVQGFEAVLQSQLVVDGHYVLCSTCLKSIYAGKIPRLCLSNGFEFPEIPPVLKVMTDLEERLVAGRIPFMQLRNLGMDRQYGLVGNIVNVPNDLEITTSQLPRNLKTVQVMFMRQMIGKNPVYHEVIRPDVVHKAAEYLLATNLYKEEGFVLSSTGSTLSAGDTEVSSEVPMETELEDGIESPEKTIANDADSGTSSSEEDDYAPMQMDRSLQESMLLPEEELINTVLKIAPGEGKCPLSLVYDDNAEVLSFPRIYGGVKREFMPDVKISYTDIVKSEARRYDRRACGPSKILYSYKRLLVSRVADAITICLRKKRKSDGTSITAGQLKNSEFVASLLSHDDGFRMLKGIRSSPAYWEQQQKKLMAMLRQVGITTVFMTLSAAELRWTELLIQLHYFANGERLTETQVLALTWEQKVTLVRNDPVTCARHFDHRFRAFLNLLVKPPGGVFSPTGVVEWYARYEMQQRGSIHCHMMLWIPNAPIYDHDDMTTSVACVEFIDNIITCERFTGDSELDDLVQYQLHRHTRTCRRKTSNGSTCRFNFPLPPMPSTMILEPLEKTIEASVLKKAKKDLETIKTKLKEMGRQFKEDIAFTDFISSFHISMADYILAVRSSLKRTSVLLKRSTNAIFVNQYNKKALMTWKANIDIQFVLDEYACAKYVAAYINKSSAGVSKLLRKADADIRKGNHSLRERLRMFGNIFNNFTEISAQEAAIGVLGIPLVNSSRSDIYINTSVPSERTFMLKSKQELEELPEDSEDIASFSLIEKYTKRPDQLEDIPLADFAALYSYSKGKPKSGESFPLKGCGYVAKRFRPLVIRYRRFGRETDPPNYFREQVMLFTPWRDEQAELLDINCEEKYTMLSENIAVVRRKYVSKLTDEILEDALSASAQQDDSETSAVPAADLVEEYSTDILHDIGGKKQSLNKAEFLLPPKFQTDELYAEKIRTLNKRQRQYLLHLVHRVKAGETPFYEFLSGGAGVGKTHLLLAIVQTLLRYFSKQPGQQLNNCWVIVCAPTGKAAFKLHGMTLHHCWRLPPSQYHGNLARLDEDLCNALRVKLTDMKLVIIDEVSMMSVQQLYQVDVRLRQIFQTDRHFGGKSILVCGHLRQLEPIGGAMVFKIPKFNPLPHITGNYLWENFKLYELDEVMRQQGDAKFCHALNNMAEGTMTADDITLIKAREISDQLKPPDHAINLFYANADCTAHNSLLHAKLPGASALSVAHDRIQGYGTELQKQALLDYAKTFGIGDSDGLPYQVSLKEGALYFVSTNVDVPDGLFNGSTGTLMKIVLATNSTGEQIPVRAFMQFSDHMVGPDARRRMREYQIRQSIDLTWTSIERFTRVLQKSGKNEKIQVVRTQIPLVPCNGMTIHKSQGSDEALVVVNVKRKLRRALLYVACSRATSYNGLYIDGTFVPPPPPPADDPVTIEMARLRANPLQLSLRFFCDLDDSKTKILFHNVQSLHAHQLDVCSDHSFMSADVLAFVEPWTMPGDTYNFPNFQCVQRKNCKGCKRNSFGSVVFAKSSLANLLSNVDFRSYVKELTHLHFTTWTQGTVQFIVVYKSPGFSTPNSLRKLNTLLTKQDQAMPLVLFGDFNISADQPEGLRLMELVNSFGLFSVLPTTRSTDYGTCIDYCFSNISGIEGWFYESLWSYHNPICLLLPRTVVLLPTSATPEKIKTKRTAALSIEDCLAELTVEADGIPETNVVRGSYHQGSSRFGYTAGKQCTAMVAIAAAYASHVPPSHWTSSILDEILNSGDQYYSLRRQFASADYLNATEIAGNTGNICTLRQLNGVTIAVSERDVLTGIVYGNGVDLDGLYSLSEAIQIMCNSEHKQMILTMNNYSFGILMDDEKIYFFNSHGTDNSGKPGDLGASVVGYTIAQAANDLINLLDNYTQSGTRQSFDLTPLIFTN